MSSLKIVFQNEIRRIALDNQLNFNGLVEKISKMFNVDFANYILKYRDEEGEVVTITSDEELLEALKIFKNEIFRVHVVKKPQVQPQRPAACGTRSSCCPGAQRQQPAANFWQFLQQLQKLRNEDAENDDDEEEDESPRKAIHFNIICDGCDARPVVGIRYKSTTKDNYDLCEKCFEKVSAEEKKTYTAIERPSFGCPYFSVRQEQPAPSPVPVPAPATNNNAEKKEEVVEKKESVPVVEKKEPTPVVISTLPAEPQEVKKVEPIPQPSAPALYPDVIAEKKEEVVEKKESAPQPAPAPATNNKFEQLIQSLNDMGFVNRQNNIAALVRARGNLVQAIQFLLNEN